jgi:hypothetical protein
MLKVTSAPTGSISTHWSFKDTKQLAQNERGGNNTS